MASILFLWNFVNLLNAEGGWILTLALMIFGVFLFTKLLKYVLMHLHQKFKNKGQPWAGTLLPALFQPLNCYIWLLVLGFSIDLVSDRFFSQQFIEEIKLILRLSAVLMLSWFLMSWKKNMLTLVIEKQKMHEIHIDTGRLAAFSKLATAVIIVITILLLMEVSGESFKTILAFGGISGLALAIASQEIVSNFFGSFMLYVTRPFAVGDKIVLPGSNLSGDVEDIGWYQTELLGEDKKPIYIPNSLFSKAYVVNSSRMTYRRLQEIISLRHEDLLVTPQIMQEIYNFLAPHQGVTQADAITVNIHSITPYAVDISIYALSHFAKEPDFLKFKDELYIKVGEILNKYKAQFALKTINEAK